jgi:hypothetical protein
LLFGREGGAESESWLVLTHRRAPGRGGSGWYAAQLVGSNEAVHASWRRLAGDSIQVVHQDPFNSGELRLAIDEQGASGSGMLTTDQLQEVGPGQYSQQMSQWAVTARRSACAGVRPPPT